MSTKRIMGTNGTARAYKRWPEALKREIVAASFASGASVSMVARQYDVNANQVFNWRKRYPGAAAPSATSPPLPALLPVTILPERDSVSSAAPSVPPSAEAIEIEVGGVYRVRVGSSFDDRALGRILDLLSRAEGARVARADGVRKKGR